jgi:purine-cytosine permease-like protein
MLQVIVVMLREAWLGLIADEFGERAYWVFFEAVAIIIVALVMEKRQRNRTS